MTEPEPTEFNERIHRPILSRGAARGGSVLGSALLFAVGVMSVMGASPTPSTGADPSAAPSAGASAAPTDPNVGPMNGGPMNGGPMMGGRGFGFGRGDMGPGIGIGSRGVTITAIDGSNLSLKTDDGWTRTIAVASDTTITRAGKTITVADLKVGDEISFHEDRQTDGTYKITDVHLVVPTVFGQVTKVDGSTITVQGFGGTTQTIHVDGTTTYDIAGVASPTLSDVKVDAFIVAQGTLRADGSLDAEAVASGMGHMFDRDGDGHGSPGANGPNGASPSASPVPSANAG